MFSPRVVEDVQQHLLRAQVSLDSEAFPAALASLRSAIALMPVLPEPHFYLAGALHRTGDLPSALAAYRCAIERAAEVGRPFPQACMGLGQVAAELGDREASRTAYEQALNDARIAVRQDRRSATAHVVLGTALFRLCRFSEALDSYRAASKLDATDIRVRTYAVQMLLHLGRYKAAVEMCDGVLSTSPGDATAHTMKGLALMALGRWRDGLDQYRWRWAMPDFPSPRPPAGKPEWTGQDVQGRTVIVYWEQGHGDVIQFARFAGLLAQRGATVLFAAKPPLIRLLSTVPGIARCFFIDGPLPDHDFISPVMNLAVPFVNDNGAVPAPVPYLAPDPADVAKWATAINFLPGLKVGLAWAGSGGHMADTMRSISLTELAALAEVPRVSFVSLQQGPREHDGGLALFRPGLLADFAETAALIETLDLVITVDTAVAHLAGALGKPVWLMLSTPAEWRWGPSGSTTPWYPTMRLYRQAQQARWAGPVTAVCNDLRTLAEASAR